MRSPTVLLATWGGLGLAPRAPGTFGSLGALPLAWLSRGLPLWFELGLIAALTLLGIWVSSRIERRWGTHDHGAIVIDEVAGQWLALALPLQLLPDGQPLWLIFASGFVWFRLFDIVKPWPIGWVDRRVAGGAGVMADDVVAGLIAAAVLMLQLSLLAA